MEIPSPQMKQEDMGDEVLVNMDTPMEEGWKKIHAKMD